MTNAIKQIVDTDGEPMMEVVVHSDCSAVDMEAIHAEALKFNNAYNTLYVYAPGDAVRDVWPNLTEIERIVSVEFAHKQALYENQQDDDAIEYFAAYGSRLNLETFTQHQIKRIADFCHTEALELNNEIDDGRTMDMYHKWNTAPTAQIRRDMLAVAHEEALEMNSARTLKAILKFATTKHFGAYQVIRNNNEVISTLRVAVLGSIEVARDQACEVRDACEDDSPKDRFHVRFVPFYLFAGSPFRPVIM